MGNTLKQRWFKRYQVKMGEMLPLKTFFLSDQSVDADQKSHACADRKMHFAGRKLQASD